MEIVHSRLDGKRFLSIKDASTVTGLSQYYLRAGCRAGSVPCIRSGRKYLVDVQALNAVFDEIVGVRS
ncbi:MAG: hypothetical protein ACI4P4_17560 [Faecousia sp.]